MEQFLDDAPLTMEFEAGNLVKVAGVRPDYMDGQSLIRLVKRLAKLNLAQELEIARYKAEVESNEAEMTRLHDRNLDADVVQRRDLFAAAVMMSVIRRVQHTAHGRFSQSELDQRLAITAFRVADAMEAARSEKEPG